MGKVVLIETKERTLPRIKNRLIRNYFSRVQISSWLMIFFFFFRLIMNEQIRRDNKPIYSSVLVAYFR